MPNLINDLKNAQNPFKSPPRPIKGWMLGLDAQGRVNLRPPLVFQFSYNPTEVRDHKEVHYAVTNIPGLDRPFYTYSHGGERVIEFTVLVNAYEYGTESSTLYLDVPGMGGIQSEVAKLRSFLYPDYQEKSWSGAFNTTVANGVGGLSVLSWLNIDNSRGQRRAAVALQFTPPPKCLFGFGAQVLECIVKDIDIKFTLWNSVLDPLRAEAKIVLGVDENSARTDQFHAHRRLLSTLGLVNINPLASIPTYPSVGRIL